MNRSYTLVRSAILFGVLFACGCSRTTMREIGEKHKPEIEAMLAELKMIAESIPQTDFDPKAKLAIEPYMHVADRLSNTAMGSKDNFLGIDKRTDDPTYFEMYTYAYREMTTSDRFAAEPADTTFESEIRAFLDLNYAIVYYPVDYREAVLTEKEFSIDPLKMIVAMYDLKNNEWIFAKSFMLDPPETIKFSYRDGQKESNAVFTVKEHFINAVKPQITEYFESHVGGTLEFDHEAYRRDGTRRSGF